MKLISKILIQIILKGEKRHLATLFEKLLESNKTLVYENYRTRFNLPDSFKFNGNNILLYGEGQIIIGENSYIGENSTIQSIKNFKVKIGKNCAISHNVRIYTASKDANQNFNIGKVEKIKSGNVNIQNGVWIGANVFINPGITIGENSVIGANSVVTKDLEKNCIYGGVPAKFISRKDNT